MEYFTNYDQWNQDFRPKVPPGVIIYETHQNVRISVETDANSQFVSIVGKPIWELADSNQRVETILPGLTIPAAYRRGIARVGEISEEGFKHLLQALKDNPTADTAEAWAAKIANDVPSVPKEHLKDIVASIGSMKGVLKSAHVDATRFSADIWDALEDDSPELAANIDPKIFRYRTEVLLNETDLYLTSVKVRELRTEVERSFYGVRILTDLRTVFGDDASQRPAMTPIHTLEIKYHHESGQHREFYVCLDDDDLVALKEVVERAQQKKATLVELLKKAEFELYE